MRFVRLRLPPARELDRLRTGLAGRDLSYSPGILSGPVPRGFTVDRHRLELGTGPETWDRARAALKGWMQFDVGWAGIATGATAPHPGQIVIVHGAWFGITFLAPCRVLHTYDREDDKSATFGLVYGTLPGHVVTGEESFEVTFDKNSGVVAYELYAMAAPGRWFTRVGRPLLDRYRARFRIDSATAMAHSVGEPNRR